MTKQACDCHDCGYCREDETHKDKRLSLLDASAANFSPDFGRVNGEGIPTALRCQQFFEGPRVKIASAGHCADSGAYGPCTISLTSRRHTAHYRVGRNALSNLSDHLV
jgi:hypothetical protein